jgi:hypothetical protein
LCMWGVPTKHKLTRYFVCDRVATCHRHAIAFPETLSLTEVFLGIAFVCLGLAVWRFYNKSPGRLCHAKHASSAWGSSHRVPCCRACLRMREWLPWDLVVNIPDGQGKCITLGHTTASCRLVFVGLPLGGPNTNLSLFPPCYMWYGVYYIIKKRRE